MGEEKNNNLDQELEEQLMAASDVSEMSKEKEIEGTKDPQEEIAETADPFQRLAKKKVAKAQSMQEMMDKQVKKGRKISPKYFLIGCGLFFLFFLGLMFVGLYYAISSASVLESIGLEISDVKTILMIFAVLFFGLIFFIGFYILVLNIYRLVTVKGKKIKYVFGLFLGIIVLVATIIGGTLSVNRIQSLSGEQKLQTNLLVAPYVMTRDENIIADRGIPLIAPLKMKYQLNKAQIDRYVLPSLQGSEVISYIVDCGNDQQLRANPAIYLGQNNGFFNDHCLYMEKGEYLISLIVEYTDRQGNTQQQMFEVAPFNIQAAIDVAPIEDTAYLNDNKTEYIIGIAPINVRFRGQTLFTDLSLANDAIEWDLDGDGRVDLSNNATYEWPFDISKLHTISYRLPELSGRGNIWFTFDLRVVESELALCSLQIEETNPQQRTFTFTPSFNEPMQAQSYHYTIYDTIQGDIIEKLKESSDSTSFSFPRGGTYTVSASYFTSSGEKGSCEPEQVDVGFNGNQVSFDLRWKESENQPFIPAGDDELVFLQEENSLIKVSTLPAILEFSVTDIQPDPTADLTVFYNERQIFPDRDGVYEVAINSLGEKSFVFEIETKQGNISEQAYTIDVSRATVKAMINIEPDTVGADPFEVTLDASISPLYDEEDEIVYFTWDFGDGQTRENISQGKITHTYRFDEENNNGEFYPSVTVRTKMGYEDSYRVPSPISVKRKQKDVIIRVESHPTQQVRIGELVTFALDTDGVVNNITWNFGNQKSFSCDDRSCASSTMRYDEPGEYEIKAEVQYNTDTAVVGRVKIKVYE